MRAWSSTPIGAKADSAHALSSKPTSVSATRSGAVLLNIQALRALAAFLVVFVHLQPLATRAGADPHFFDFGNAGVDLFFVISGMIMVFTTGQSNVTASSFMAHRIARVVPFYWLVTLTVFGVALLAPSMMQATRADPFDLVRSLAFIPFEKANGLVQPIVFVGWTLNYEMAFYLLFAAGMLTGRRGLGLMLTGALLLIAAGVGFTTEPKGIWGTFYTAPIIVEFGLGMAIGRAMSVMPRWRTMRFLAGSVAVAAFGLMIAGSSLWPDIDRLFIFGLPASILVGSALILEGGGVVFASSLVRRLGDASYATYLTHFFVTQAITKSVFMLGLTESWQMVLAILAAFVLVGAAGLLIHATVERSLNAATRRWIPSSRSRSPEKTGRDGGASLTNIFVRRNQTLTGAICRWNFGRDRT